MSNLVGRTGHSCGARQALNLYEEKDGRITGFCFSCKKYEPDPLGGNTMEKAGIERTVKTKEEVQKELDEVAGYKSHGLDDRRIHKKTVEYFGVKTTLDQERQEKVAVHYYPYESYDSGEIEGYKFRIVDGKIIRSMGNCKRVLPFGWSQAVRSGSPKLFITEGEIDAMSLFETIMIRNKGTQYEGNIPAVVSVPHGAAAAGKDIALVLSDIRKHFKEVVLVFDNDEAGKAAVDEVLKIMPEAKVATVPGKDVNECVLEGHVKALFKAVMWDAGTPKNTRLVYAEDLFEAGKTPAEYGLSWPWKETTRKTRGIRFGETIYIGAAQKMGKSEVVNAIAAHLIKEHGLKVMLAKPEEANVKSVKLLAGKISGNIFHDPEVAFDERAYDAACGVMRGKVVLLNLYQHLGWETLKSDIRASAAQGVKAVFIDPITNLVNGMDAAAANTKLQEIAQELAAMALDLNIVIFIFCHLRNPESGTPHERGGKVLSSQFAGSRAMARSCNYMFGIEGNKDPDLPEDDRNCRQFVLLEDREFGEVGATPLYWNKHNGLFTEL
jgi:twinkle protein